MTCGDEHGDNTTSSMPSIPILKSSDTSHHSLIGHFYQILASTRKVTIVCGAGISTHAGIPDFRSENGLLNQTFGENGQLKGSELFESATLRDPNKLKAFSQQMTRMRISACEANLTGCHGLVERLYDTKRLLRCYTQNIDGLQTRNQDDMAGVVFELHGTNVYLKCNICKKRPDRPASDFDRQLLSGGYALCPSCSTNPARMVGNSRNLRCTKPGELLPDILLNDEVVEPWKNGKTIDQLAAQDAKCPLLLIIGTRLKPWGAARLVKGLAMGVHQSGGKVVYIDWTPLSTSVWTKHVDLHIQMDIEEWAKGCLNALKSTQTTRPGSWTAAQVSALSKQVHAGQLDNQVTVYPQLNKRPAIKAQTTCRDEKRVRFSFGVQGDLFEEKSVERTPILFVVYHAQWATFDARVLASMMKKACASLGRECYYYIVKLRGNEEEPIVPPKSWSSFYLVVVHVSWYTQFLHAEERPSPKEREITEMLKYSSRTVERVAQRAVWSLAVMLCQEDELLSEPDVETLDLQVKRATAFDAAIASVDLTRFRLGGWIALILGVLSSDPTRETSKGMDLLDWTTRSWMGDGDAFNHSDLVLFSKQQPPYMLLASHFDERERPLGKRLPDIGSVCLCSQPRSESWPEKVIDSKRWVIQHDATDKQQLHGLRITATCSSCGTTWVLPCDNLNGRIRCIDGRCSVELALDAANTWVVYPTQ